MSADQSKASSSASSSPQEPTQQPAVTHYPPAAYSGHYPPTGPYPPPFYAYPVPDPSHHDPNNPNGAPTQPVAPFFMAVPPPPPGMVYAYPMPPTAPGEPSFVPFYLSIDLGSSTWGFTSPQGYPFAPGMPAPQPPPKPKRKQVKMAVSNRPFVMRPIQHAPWHAFAGVMRIAPYYCKPPVGLGALPVLFRPKVIAVLSHTETGRRTVLRSRTSPPNFVTQNAPTHRRAQTPCCHVSCMGRFSLDSGWSTGAVFDSHRRACSHGAFGRIKNADRVRWLREAALLALPRDPLLSLILYAVR